MAAISVEIVRSTIGPQTLVYWAMRSCKHDDYASEQAISESEAGELICKHLLGKHDTKGHWGPFEHPQITVFSRYVPQYVLNQLRTHRVGVTFDAYSMRDGKRELAGKILKGKATLSEFFEYDAFKNDGDDYFYEALAKYHEISETDPELARSYLPSCYLTSFMMSANLRSALHLCDLRLKGDVQSSTVDWCIKFYKCLEQWCPEVCNWYNQNRYGKAALSP
jgi:thymidylate synthase (FAD)